MKRKSEDTAKEWRGDSRIIFEGKPTKLRVEVRNPDEDHHSGPMEPPDICQTCRNAIVARTFGLKPEAG